MKPLIVKTVGLHGGRGAIVCWNEQELVDAIQQVLEFRQFGDIKSVVIEPFEWKAD